MSISPAADNTYSWIEWIVGENRELDFVEQERVRRYTQGNLHSISPRILKQRMEKTVEIMERELMKKLPKKFGVSFDSWSERGVHYLAVFAVGSGVPNDGVVLLGFRPFEQESDLSAEEHQQYISGLLDDYHRTVLDIMYLVGDNCKVNRKLSNILDIPLIGCNSHKLNLAVHKFLGLDKKDEETAQRECNRDQLQRRLLLQKLGLLMKKLKTIKNNASLRQITDFVAFLANATKWNGNYRMVHRFLDFVDAVNAFILEGGDVAKEVGDLMLTTNEIFQLKALDKSLTEFHSVSLFLQKRDGITNLADVRELFDQLIDDYGNDFKFYLAANAEIVNNPEFENAICKYIRGERLNAQDEATVRCLECSGEAANDRESNQDEESASSSDYAASILTRSRKRQKFVKRYVDLTKIPVASNVVERLYSEVKINLTDMRNRLLPSTLEMVMFLKLNSGLMSKQTVQEAMMLLKSTPHLV